MKKQTILAIVVIATLVLPWAVFADTVTNDVVVGGNDTFVLGGSTTIDYKINATGGDGQPGCNASDGSPATVTIVITPGSGVTATPGALTFNYCGNPPQPVVFTATAAGDYAITVTVSDSGPGSYHTLPAAFTLHVLAPPPPSDTTPPTASPTQAPAANGYGWNNTDVTVYWNWADEEGGSGIDPDNCTTETLVTGESANLEAYATCYDLAGNMGEATYYVNIDRTPPTVAVTGVANGATYIKGSVPAAGCSTEDALSGVQTEATVAVTGGSPVDPAVGTFTATCSGGTDYADNVANPVSVTYYVVYDWAGFFQPVDNLPTFNIAKAGSSIPVKFNLGGYQGLSIFAVAPSVALYACGSVPGDEIEAYSAGNSSLTYDFQAQQYVYVWKTEKSYAPKCGVLHVKLIDGTDHTANFKFK